MKKPTIFFLGILIGGIYSFFFVTIGNIDMHDIFRSWGWKDGRELLRFMVFAFFLILSVFGLLALFGWLYEKFIEK